MINTKKEKSKGRSGQQYQVLKRPSSVHLVGQRGVIGKLTAVSAEEPVRTEVRQKSVDK